MIISKNVTQKLIFFVGEVCLKYHFFPFLSVEKSSCYERIFFIMSSFLDSFTSTFFSLQLKNSSFNNGCKTWGVMYLTLPYWPMLFWLGFEFSITLPVDLSTSERKLNITNYYYEGTLSVMVIVLGNAILDPSSNPGRKFLCFTLHKWKAWILSSPFSSG